MISRSSHLGVAGLIIPPSLATFLPCVTSPSHYWSSLHSTLNPGSASRGRSVAKPDLGSNRISLTAVWTTVVAGPGCWSCPGTDVQRLGPGRRWRWGDWGSRLTGDERHKKDGGNLRGYLGFSFPCRGSPVLDGSASSRSLALPSPARPHTHHVGLAH